MSIQTADVQNKSTATTAIVTSPWPLILYKCPSEIIKIKKKDYSNQQRDFFFKERDVVLLPWAQALRYTQGDISFWETWTLTLLWAKYCAVCVKGYPT